MKWISSLLAVLLCFAASLPLLSAQTESPSVTGKWHFVFNTGDGERTFDANFDVDGEKVTGSWRASGEEKGADVKGTYRDGKLNLEFAVANSEVGPGTLTIKGDVAADSITGTWTFQEYDGSFKATRPQ